MGDYPEDGLLRTFSLEMGEPVNIGVSCVE